MRAFFDDAVQIQGFELSPLAMRALQGTVVVVGDVVVAEQGGVITTVPGVEVAVPEIQGTPAPAPPAPPVITTSTGIPFPPPPSSPSIEWTPVLIVATLFVAAPIAIAYARLLWRRGSLHGERPRDLESTERMIRLEQAVDAIALDVDRVAEGQRFLTNVLTEASQAELAARSR